MAMLMASAVLVFCFLLGFLTGLRSMSGIALVCWAIHLGWLSVAQTPLSFLGSTISLIVFSLLAAGELIADKLPRIPSRTDIGPLIARMVFGALCGWVLARNGHAAVAAGAVCAAVGAVVGAFAGFHVRRAITQRGVKDILVALLEDLIAVGGGLWLVSRF